MAKRKSFFDSDESTESDLDKRCQQRRYKNVEHIIEHCKL